MVKIKIMVARGKIIGKVLFIFSLGVIVGGTFLYSYQQINEVLNEGQKAWEYVSSRQVTLSPVNVAEASNLKPESVPEVIERVAKEKGFKEVDTLKKIAFCESSNNRLAENAHSSAKGIFQILDMHQLSVQDRFDVEKSVRWAIDRAAKRGFVDWNASKDCWNK